jgi:hypothetical protein
MVLPVSFEPLEEAGMSKKGNLAFFLCFLNMFLAAQTPGWYLDKEKQYPPDLYIAAVGEGATRAAAESAAVAGIAFFFSTSTEVRNEAIREFNEAVVNNTTDFSKKTYVSESAVITSDADFLGVRFASPWENVRARSWAALAYIDRQEASAIYDSKISANAAALTALSGDAAREQESFYACSLLYRAIRIAGLTEEFIKTAAVLDSAAARKYEEVLSLINKIRSDYRSKREGLSFGIIVEGDRNGRIQRKLGELLEQNGYVISRRNPPYTVAVSLSLAEETLPSGLFIRAGLSVRIERGKKTLFSYSKNYNRYGHTTLDGAYNRALLAVERDLEENFIAKLTASVGR